MDDLFHRRPCRARGLRCLPAPASRPRQRRPGSSGRWSPAPGHGAQRTHATIGLVGAALEQLDFARRFFGTGQHGADHDRWPGGDGLGDVAGEADAAVGNQRNAGALPALQRHGDRGDLRHADTGHDTGGADGARADTDLDRVGSGFGQRQAASAVAMLPPITCMFG
jgi:hypothetical protein